ncbi:MAG: bifunctional adenosylcobinamide kinase/adenosylcobinamide-phosphate guanylyltransferase [Thermodesulfobacteriota bacterium]
MTRGRCILIGGGARSGKSSFALVRARELGARRVFLATAEALDGEMRARVAAHRSARGDDFATVEEPLELAHALRSIGHSADVVVVDCLTLWLANLLVRGEEQGAVLARVDELATTVAASPFASVLVTNEVGMGIVPENALARAFRDVAGLAHQRLARDADEIHLAALGVLLRLRPAPVEVRTP